MAKDPSFPFYAQDFLVETLRWTRAMQGLHVSLLSEAWANGILKDNQGKPTGIEKEDMPLWEQIKSHWLLENGYWKNKTLEELREKRKKFNQSQREKIAKRWNKQKVQDIEETTEPSSVDTPLDINNNAVSTELIPIHQPNGKDLVYTETIPSQVIPLESENEKEIESKKGGMGENNSVPLGMEKVKEVAATVWQDEGWKQSINYGHGLDKDSNQLKRWMSLFNARLSNDQMPNFSKSLYKKLFGGWLSLQLSKGRKLVSQEIDIGQKPLEKLHI